MKIWVVLPGYDYEGYGEPEAAFSTAKAAELYIEKQRKRRLGGREAFELEVDDEASAKPLVDK